MTPSTKIQAAHPMIWDVVNAAEQDRYAEQDDDVTTEPVLIAKAEPFTTAHAIAMQVREHPDYRRYLRPVQFGGKPLKPRRHITANTVKSICKCSLESNSLALVGWAGRSC